MINKKEKRKLIKDYIKNNTTCTYKQIRNETKLKVERFYKNMKYAYRAAGIPFSKNLKKRNKEKQRIEVIDYIKINMLR